MTIVLTYTEEDGTQQQVEYEDDVIEIDLSSKMIASIDLTPLAMRTCLQTLHLYENKFQLLDLTPLSTCTNLHKFHLYKNQIQLLDLTPLTTCINLRTLSLGGNQLQSLDLTPLSTCTNLHEFHLYENKFQLLDLTPLIACTNLRTLSLHDDDQLQSSYVIYSWLRQEDTKYVLYNAIYKRPISTYPWSFLDRIAQRFGSDRRVQQDILCAMGCRNYGFIDCDLDDLFLSISADTLIEMAREQVRKKLLEEITRIVDTRGATTGLDVEELSAHHAEIAKRIQRIIELREAEMQRVIVKVRDTEVDLRELWLTAYDYEVLTALELHDFTDLEGLEKVKTAFSELGFELKTDETSRSGVKMSDELKHTIWWIAQNKDRPWSNC